MDIGHGGWRVIVEDLDGEGPVENTPYANYIHTFVKGVKMLIHKKWIIDIFSSSFFSSEPFLNPVHQLDK